MGIKISGAKFKNERKLVCFFNFIYYYRNFLFGVGLGNERNSNEIYAIYVNFANFFLRNTKFRE